MYICKSKSNEITIYEQVCNKPEWEPIVRGFTDASKVYFFSKELIYAFDSSALNETTFGRSVPVKTVPYKDFFTVEQPIG
jgi:hypothetical protein